jgi:hypothetical protein
MTAEMQQHESAERLAIERLLAFVNLREVTNADAVFALFFEADSPRIAEMIERDGAPAWRPLWPQVGGVSARALESDRAESQVMLEAFARSKTAARKRFGREISGLVGKGLFAAVPRFDGRLAYELRYLSTGVEASAGFGLSLLFDSSRTFGKALRRCALPSCRSWFLSIARGAGGPRPIYCTEAHQVEADKLRAVERARQWRADHAKRRGK